MSETSYIRRNGKKFLLIIDGYACHIDYQKLKLLCDNDIIVDGLPAHTSHLLQSSDAKYLFEGSLAFEQ